LLKDDKLIIVPNITFPSCDLTVNNYLLWTAESRRSSASLLDPIMESTKSIIQQEMGMVLWAARDQRVNFIAHYFLRFRTREATSRTRTLSKREFWHMAIFGLWLEQSSCL
jgi:hypothetical protein